MGRDDPPRLGRVNAEFAGLPEGSLVELFYAIDAVAVRPFSANGALTPDRHERAVGVRGAG